MCYYTYDLYNNHTYLSFEWMIIRALFNIHESIEPIIPGSDANALSANLPSSCDRAFNLFFIHPLAQPFLSLVVVLCDVGVDVLGPPDRASIRTPSVIPKASCFS